MKRFSREDLKECLLLAIFWYAITGIVFLLIHKDDSIPTWGWWALYVLNPIMLIAGIAVAYAFGFALLAIWIFAKIWLYDPFPNFWDAVKGVIAAPFNFLESKINESEAKFDFKKATFYKMLAGALFLAGMILVGVILHWLGFSTSDE